MFLLLPLVGKQMRLMPAASHARLVMYCRGMHKLLVSWLRKRLAVAANNLVCS
jgi:hypothetical protein